MSVTGLGGAPSSIQAKNPASADRPSRSCYRHAAAPGHRSGLPDRGDVELQCHLLADQDPGRGVPVHAPVLAIDRDTALEADPPVAPRIVLAAVQLDVPVSRLVY